MKSFALASALALAAGRSAPAQQPELSTSSTRGAASPLSSLQQELASIWSAGRASAGGPSARPHEVFAHALAAAQARLTSLRASLPPPPSPRMVQPSVGASGHSYYPDTPAGYYAVIPEYLTSTPASGAPVSWTSTCLTANTATLASSATGVTLSISSSGANASAPFCSDLYLVATCDYLNLVDVSSPGVLNLNISTPRPAWVDAFGVRIFRFIHDPLTTVGDALNTISLFIPALIEPVLDADSEARNAQFLRDYVGLNITARTAGTIDMDWSYVQSGDLFVVSRLDGLGTMEQWGTGATSSHIVMPMRFGPNNDLYIVESTAKDAYWPLDNIQMNAIQTWLPMAEASSYSVIHLPLSDAIRAVFNVTAAQNYILDTIGFPYGYHNFVNTFFDTENGNLPWPASIEFVEVIANLLESIDRNVTDQIFSLAINKRLGTTGLDLADAAVYAATKMNMSFGAVVAMPEQDDWVYPDGPSMVCDVYWCSIHKAGGSFGALGEGQTFSCREFHNLDVYSLNFFNLTAPRPAVCVAADPDIPYCQIMGNHTLLMPGVNSRAPYAKMSQTCSMLPLDYTRTPAGC